MMRFVAPQVLQAAVPAVTWACGAGHCKTLKAPPPAAPFPRIRPGFASR